jgi:hypothetical protein
LILSLPARLGQCLLNIDVLPGFVGGCRSLAQRVFFGAAGGCMQLFRDLDYLP